MKGPCLPTLNMKKPGGGRRRYSLGIRRRLDLLDSSEGDLKNDLIRNGQETSMVFSLG